jgi:serine/threonine-protein kinase
VEPRWQRVAAIFDVVVELPPAEQAGELERLCAGNADVQREVAALLGADAVSGAFDHAIDVTRVRAAADWVETVDRDAPGTDRIGPWRIERELGRGGMGVVFLVERADGQFQQRAALKLIKRGMESEAVLARFLRERQLLARLTHPNIASLLDGGMSADGRPYFVMQYVEGVPLPAYCAARALDLGARIELIRQVCAAVQFAHRQLVVHRDIKPANVLVTAGGEVKLLDFGIAKLLDNDTDGEGTQTIDGRSRPLTPAYAAPEQLRGEPVTTATDVYSLGCLLHELLTGRRAHEAREHSNRQQWRQVRDEAESPPPSSVTPVDRTHPVAAHRLRGDLDTIVLTALQREPERRYATVAAFSDDLHRYLEGQPITARRDTFLYRMSKFIARHRSGVAVAVLAVAGLVAATTFALWSAAREREAARRAETVTNFLIDIFRVADPNNMPGGVKLSAVDVLDAGAQRVGAQLAGQPQLATRFAEVLGTIYTELGQYDKAIALMQGAIERRDGSIDARAQAGLFTELARAEYEKGDYAQAGKDVESALTRHLAIDGRRGATVAPDLALQGEIARRQGDFTRADSLLQEALAISRAALKAPHAQIATQLNEYAAVKGDMRQVEEGSALTEEALAMFRRLYGENHLDVAENLANLGTFRMQMERVGEAPALFDQATAIYRRLLPADHPMIAGALNNHARALDRLARYREAEPLFLEALAMQRRLLDETHPDIAATLNNLALLHAHMDDFAGSADYSRRAFAVWVAQGKPEHPFALASKANLAVALRESGDLAGAESLFREVLAARRQQLGERHLLVSFTLDHLGILSRLGGRSGEAVELHREAQDIRKSLPGVPTLEAAVSRVQYALSLNDVSDSSKARAEVDAALTALAGIKPINNEQLANGFVAKARIALGQGDVEAGCAAAEKALELRPTDDETTGWRHAEALAVHGRCLVARGDTEHGDAEQASALATLQRVRGPDHWMTLQVRDARNA